MACGFSSLEMRGTSQPRRATICRTIFTSAAVRTKERATASTPCLRPNSRSRRSFSVRAGIDKAVPGKLIPWCSARAPPFKTSQTTSRPRRVRTRNSIRPSRSRTRAPGDTSPARSGNVVEMRVAVPAISRGVISTVEPLFSRTGSWPSRRPVRILGPCRSCRIQTVRFSFSAARRRRSMLRA